MVKILKHCFIKEMLPTKIWYEITHRCNSKCKNCNIWQGPFKKEEELTPDDLYKIFSDPLFSKVDTILISGGEPSLRNDLYECVLAIHKALPYAEINIATNGLQPEFFLNTIERILNNNISIGVGTSIDGLGDNHDLIRGKGSWKKVNQLIDGLIELREQYGNQLVITFGTVLTPENNDEIWKIVRWGEFLRLDYLIQWYNNSSYYSNLETEVDRGREREIVLSLDSERFSLLKEKWLDWLDGKSIKFNCYALRDFLVIKANGDVAPCLSYWAWCIGNLKKDSPLKVWEGYLRQCALVTVHNCQGCLNSWGTFWSWNADGWPYVRYFITHPRQLLSKMIKHD